jgi:hypothetical protein
MTWAFFQLKKLPWIYSYFLRESERQKEREREQRRETKTKKNSTSIQTQTPTGKMKTQLCSFLSPLQTFNQTFSKSFLLFHHMHIIRMIHICTKHIPTWEIFEFKLINHTQPLYCYIYMTLRKLANRRNPQALLDEN